MNRPESPAEVSLEAEIVDSPARSLFRFVAALAVGLLGLLVIVGTRVRMIRMIEEFEVQFSAATSFALSWVLPACLFLTLGITVAVELLVRQRTIQNAWNSIALGVALACIAVYVAGVALPLLELIKALS
jgi:hypothetical protein